jgi:hypothetical protein
MKRNLIPMSATNLRALVDRTYRESHPFQWVREALINAKQAGATKVYFGVEWQGVETKGVYRRLILDNGCGMDPERMLLFLNTYGGSGKPIGGEHENFGHGFKTSTLPWNKNGIVVVSKFQGVLAMARLIFDERIGEYGVRLEDVDDTRLGIYAPYDATDEDGVDYTRLIPEEWESGVAILLLGSDQQPDTILGAYNRDEADLNGIAKYLNTRLWELNEIEVKVDYFSNTNRKLWPKQRNDREMSNTTTQKWATRNVFGAKHHIVTAMRDSKLVASGTVPIAGGLGNVHWFLRDGTVTQSSSVANYRGYIGHLYQDELYTILNHPSSFRSFGVPAWLKENVFLIVEPKVFDGQAGAYPNDSRTSLLLGGRDAGRTLPIPEWSNEFANSLPPEISAKIAEHFDELSGTIRDDAWKARLIERFGFKWKVRKPVVSAKGTTKIQPVQSIARATPSGNGGAAGGGTGMYESRAGRKQAGTGFASDDGVSATERRISGGLPDYYPRGKEDFDAPWVLAAWTGPNATNNYMGCVLVNRDHQVIQSHIAETQRQFAEQYADEIAEEVVNVYGELAVAHVAHSERMRAIMTDAEVDSLRTDKALTMSLLGMWQIDAILLPRISGKMVKRKSA